MPLYRKKPVIIEAFQLLEGDIQAHDFGTNLVWPKWFKDALVKNKYAVGSARYSEIEEGVVLQTLEGSYTARINDWIIKGIQGELYPCKPDIFEETYEEV